MQCYYLWISGPWHLWVTLLGLELFSSAYSVWLKQKTEVGIFNFLFPFVFDVLGYLPFYIKLRALFYLPLIFNSGDGSLWFHVLGGTIFISCLSNELDVTLIISRFALLLAAELVERVVLLGAPISIKDENWEAARKVYMGKYSFTLDRASHLFYGNEFFLRSRFSVDGSRKICKCLFKEWLDAWSCFPCQVHNKHSGSCFT